MIIIRIVFLAICFLMVCQWIVVYKYNKKKKSFENQFGEYIESKQLGDYSDAIDGNKLFEAGNRAINAVELGRIKKQLLHNDAPAYDADLTARQYMDFVGKSDLYNSLLSMEEKRYNA